MEKQVCKACGRELELSYFGKSRWGGLRSVCKECVNAKNNATRQSNKGTHILPANKQNFYHSDALDSKTPREVLDVIAEAKKWLESRGYVIDIKCEYRQTIVRKVIL